jgi:hypothetical protein
MKPMTTSTSVVRLETKRLEPNHLWELAARLFWFHADRWRRRALFYERHRDYFPRLSAGRFVDRCRELEVTYRGRAEVMFALPAQNQRAVRPMVLRRKQGRRPDLSDHRTLISVR